MLLCHLVVPARALAKAIDSLVATQVLRDSKISKGDVHEVGEPLLFLALC